MQQMRRLHRAAIGVALIALAAAGCGSSSHKATPTTPATATTVDVAAATQQITTVWESFFGPNGTANQIQGMNPTLETSFNKEKSGLGKGSSAKVKKVAFDTDTTCSGAGVPAPCATVTYDIYVNGTVALPNASGYATEQGWSWLVAKSTFCALASLSGGSAPPAGC
jgi:hypothetical protein